MKKLLNGIEIEMSNEEVSEFQAVFAAAEDARQRPQDMAAYAAAIQALVDQTAQAKQFNDGVALASYKDSTIPAWAAQSASFIAWRDAVWVYSNAELEKVQNGQRLQPTIAEILAELPPMVWPA